MMLYLRLIVVFFLLSQPGVLFAGEITKAVAALQSIDDYYITNNPAKVKAAPTFSLSSPAGLAPSGGVAFFGIGGIINVPGSTTNIDGAMSLGYGLGDPVKNLALGFTLELGSLLNNNMIGFDRGNLGISIAKYFPSLQMGVGMGIKSLTLWQGGDGTLDPSIDIAVTKFLKLGSFPVVLNAGVGNNAFLRLNDRTARPKYKVAPFGAVAIYVHPQLSLVVDQTAGITTIGGGIAPVAAWPISLSFGIYDVSKIVPNHTKTSLIGSLSGAFTF
ncbi:MAG: hypothetical protein Q9M20_02185 [Mariprofundaceae bacterium]|nr:hypothetical protein [Mariprofundaceae bacterium]